MKWGLELLGFFKVYALKICYQIWKYVRTIWKLSYVELSYPWFSVLWTARQILWEIWSCVCGYHRRTSYCTHCTKARLAYNRFLERAMGTGASTVCEFMQKNPKEAFVIYSFVFMQRLAHSIKIWHWYAASNIQRTQAAAILPLSFGILTKRWDRKQLIDTPLTSGPSFPLKTFQLVSKLGIYIYFIYSS